MPRINRVEPANGINPAGDITQATVTTTTRMEFVRCVQVVPMSDAVAQLNTDLNQALAGDVIISPRIWTGMNRMRSPNIIRQSSRPLWLIACLFLTVGLVAIVIITTGLIFAFGNSRADGSSDVERYDLGDLIYGISNLSETQFPSNTYLSSVNKASVEKYLSDQLINESGYLGLFIDGIFLQSRPEQTNLRTSEISCSTNFIIRNIRVYFDYCIYCAESRNIALRRSLTNKTAFQNPLHLFTIEGLLSAVSARICSTSNLNQTILPIRLTTFQAQEINSSFLWIERSLRNKPNPQPIQSTSNYITQLTTGSQLYTTASMKTSTKKVAPVITAGSSEKTRTTLQTMAPVTSTVTATTMKIRMTSTYPSSTRTATTSSRSNIRLTTARERIITRQTFKPTTTTSTTVTSTIITLKPTIMVESTQDISSTPYVSTNSEPMTELDTSTQQTLTLDDNDDDDNTITYSPDLTTSPEGSASMETVTATSLEAYTSDSIQTTTESDKNLESSTNTIVDDEQSTINIDETTLVLPTDETMIDITESSSISEDITDETSTSDQTEIDTSSSTADDLSTTETYDTESSSIWDTTTELMQTSTSISTNRIVLSTRVRDRQTTAKSLTTTTPNRTQKQTSNYWTTMRPVTSTFRIALTSQKNLRKESLLPLSTARPNYTTVALITTTEQKNFRFGTTMDQRRGRLRTSYGTERPTNSTSRVNTFPQMTSKFSTLLTTRPVTTITTAISTTVPETSTSMTIIDSTDTTQSYIESSSSSNDESTPSETIVDESTTEILEQDDSSTDSSTVIDLTTNFTDDLFTSSETPESTTDVSNSAVDSMHDQSGLLSITEAWNTSDSPDSNVETNPPRIIPTISNSSKQTVAVSNLIDRTLLFSNRFETTTITDILPTEIITSPVISSLSLASNLFEVTTTENSKLATFFLSNSMATNETILLTTRLTRSSPFGNEFTSTILSKTSSFEDRTNDHFSTLSHRPDETTMTSSMNILQSLTHQHPSVNRRKNHSRKNRQMAHPLSTPDSNKFENLNFIFNVSSISPDRQLNDNNHRLNMTKTNFNMSQFYNENALKNFVRQSPPKDQQDSREKLLNLSTEDHRDDQTFISIIRETHRLLSSSNNSQIESINSTSSTILAAESRSEDVSNIRTMTTTFKLITSMSNVSQDKLFPTLTSAITTSQSITISNHNKKQSSIIKTTLISDSHLSNIEQKNIGQLNSDTWSMSIDDNGQTMTEMRKKLSARTIKTFNRNRFDFHSMPLKLNHSAMKFSAAAIINHRRLSHPSMTTSISITESETNSNSTEQPTASPLIISNQRGYLNRSSLMMNASIWNKRQQLSANTTQSMLPMSSQSDANQTVGGSIVSSK